MSAVNYVPDSWRVMESRYTPKNRSISGYGSKLPTRFIVVDDHGRIRRVYAICWSNVASFFCMVKGERMFVQDHRF